MSASVPVFILCACALGLAAWRGHRQPAPVSVSDLFDRMMADPATRIAVMACWWWLGWHFLVGQTIDPGAPG